MRQLKLEHSEVERTGSGQLSVHLYGSAARPTEESRNQRLWEEPGGQVSVPGIYVAESQAERGPGHRPGSQELSHCTATHLPCNLEEIA